MGDFKPVADLEALAYVYDKPNGAAMLRENVLNFRAMYDVLKPKHFLAIADVVKTSTALVELDLTDTQIDEASVVAIGHSLAHSTSLKRIFFSQNPITEKGAQAIAAALTPPNSTARVEERRPGARASSPGKRRLSTVVSQSVYKSVLQRLYLRDCSLSPGAGGALFKMLQVNTHLLELDLSGSVFGVPQIELLGEALKVNTSLHELDIDYPEVAVDLVAIAEGDEESDDEPPNLTELVATVLSEGIAANSSLKVFNITGNLKAFKAHTYLKLAPFEPEPRHLYRLTLPNGAALLNLHSDSPPVRASSASDVEAYISRSEGWALYFSDLPEAYMVEAAARLVAAAGTACPDHFIRFAVEVSVKCEGHYFRLRGTAPEAAEQARLASRLMQLAVCGVTLGKQAQMSASDDSFTPRNLWRDRHEAFEIAAVNECKFLLGFPSFQEAHSAAFAGSLGEYVDWLRRTSKQDQWGWVDVVFHCAFLLLQILVQPVLWLLLVFVPDLLPVLQWATQPKFYSSRLRAAMRACRLLPHLPYKIKVAHFVWVSDPWFRLLLDLVASLLLIAIVVSLDPHPDKLPMSAFVGLAMAVASLLHEMEELFKGSLLTAPLRTLYTYTSDMFNFFDLVALVFTIWGLAEYLHEYSADEAVRRSPDDAGADRAEKVEGHHFVLSVATLFLTLRTMKVINITETFGPYMQMLIKMVFDVLKIVVLAIPLMCGHAFALHVLFKAYAEANDGDGGCASAGDPDAQAEAEANFRDNVVFGMVVMIEQFVAGAETGIECLRGSSAGWAAWALQIVFSLVMIVLVLNMIIAAMAKTFDLIYESLDLTSMLVRAKLIQNSTSLNIAPPPLNLLGLPSRLLMCCARAGLENSPQGDTVRRFTNTFTRLNEEGEAANVYASRAFKVKLREYVQLYDSASLFLRTHRSEADGEDKFRRKISQRVLSLSIRQEKNTETLAEVQADVRAIRDKLVGGGSRRRRRG